MKNFIIGVVDYGAGNCTSVRSTLSKLGYRTRLLSRAEDFDQVQIIVLPGVGAFPAAMQKLHELNFVMLIKQWAQSGKPIIGICLGMQLLADASYEHIYTSGLGLIPGEVIQLSQPKWHIGWNSLEVNSKPFEFIKNSMGTDFYFNHSYEFKAPDEYILAITRVERPIVAMVKRDNILGMQFHPEKSQTSGKLIFQSALKELICLESA